MSKLKGFLLSYELQVSEAADWVGFWKYRIIRHGRWSDKIVNSGRYLTEEDAVAGGNVRLKFIVDGPQRVSWKSMGSLIKH